MMTLEAAAIGRRHVAAKLAVELLRQGSSSGYWVRNSAMMISSEGERRRRRSRRRARPGGSSGKVTNQKDFQPLAPRVMAAISKVES